MWTCWHLRYYKRPHMVPERLAEAEKMGARPLLLDANPEAVIRDATDGRGADVVLEVVGTHEEMQLGLSMIRPFGFVSSVGVYLGDYTFSGSMLHAKNATMAWGRCPVRGIFEGALECLVRVRHKVAFLCDVHMRMEKAAEAYEVHDIILKIY